MRGEVLGFDQSSGTGVLRAEDGRRYRFAGAQWQEATEPVKGARVDFEPSGQQATEIYLVTASGLADRLRAFPSFVRALGRWFRRHPEGAVALLLMAATALPVYGFLGVEEPLLAAPRVVERLELGLGRIRMLVSDIPDAGTAAAALRAMLPIVYLLWAVPILALLLLYRALAELPRRALAFWTGIVAVVLPVLVPLSIAVPTTVFVLSRMPPDMRATIAGSVFDAASLGPFRDIAIGGLVIMMLGFALVVWGMRKEPAPRRRPAAPAPRAPVPPVPQQPDAAKAPARPRQPAQQPAARPAVPPPPVARQSAPPRTPVPPMPPMPPQKRPPVVAGPAHPPAGKPAAPPATPPKVREFAPPLRKPAAPALPAPDDAEDPLPQVLTRGRQPAGAPPGSMDARAGEGLPAKASARGWEVEATGSMNAEMPPPAASGLRGSHADEDTAPAASLAELDAVLTNGALAPAAREAEPEPASPAAPPPGPAPRPQPALELDKGPDAVMKLYEKLRAERLARDTGKKGGD